MIVHEILAEIEEHTRSVRSGRVSPPEGPCLRCAKRPADGFRRHDRRPRTFLVVVVALRLVRRLSSYVVRWRCPLCDCRFTQCPSFALPHKRYVREEILERSVRYADQDRVTYRCVSCEDGLPVAYEASRPDAIDDRTLARSTVWRWITSLAALRQTCRQAIDMIRARSPRASILRRAFIVSPGKYRSDARRDALTSALRLVYAEAAYRPLFRASIFPMLATSTGWT